MSQHIVPFDFQGSAVRVVLDSEGEPLFVATDVAKVLGYRMAGDMTRILDDDERGTQIVRTPSGDQEMLVICESGLYSAILKSRKPEAKIFRRWVTHEVLPTIRKTGQYALRSAPTLRVAADQNFEWAYLIRSCIALYAALGLRGQRRLLAVGLLLQKRYGLELEVIAPLDEAVEQATADRLLSPFQLGLALGKTAREVNQLLQDLGLQVHDGNQWVSTDKGKSFCELRGMGKYAGSRHGKRSLRWLENATLSIIREYRSHQRENAKLAVLRLVGR
ncbi:MAG: BRO-N domain-containing protein [Acidithiobacillus ferriphilus]